MDDSYGYDHWKINPKTRRRTRSTTRRAYAYAWRRYTAWCESEGCDPWDDPKGKTFAGFIEAMTRAGLKATTLRQVRAAIVYRYATDPALHRRKDPTETRRAKEAMAEIAELDDGRRKPQALEMTPDVLERVLCASAVRRSGEGHDAALLRHAEADATLRLMFDAALRVDDMSRVEWADRDDRLDDNGNRTLYVRPGKTRHDRFAPITPDDVGRTRALAGRVAGPARPHHHRQQRAGHRPAHPTPRRLRRNPHHGPLGTTGPRFERRQRRGHRVRPNGARRLEVPSDRRRVRQALEGQQGRRPAVSQRPRRARARARPGGPSSAPASRTSPPAPWRSTWPAASALTGTIPRSPLSGPGSWSCGPCPTRPATALVASAPASCS